jgi:hypothetical protein
MIPLLTIVNLLLMYYNIYILINIIKNILKCWKLIFKFSGGKGEGLNSKSIFTLSTQKSGLPLSFKHPGYAS